MTARDILIKHSIQCCLCCGSGDRCESLDKKAVCPRIEEALASMQKLMPEYIRSNSYDCEYNEGVSDTIKALFGGGR